MLSTDVLFLNVVDVIESDVFLQAGARMTEGCNLVGRETRPTNSRNRMLDYLRMLVT